MSGRVSQPTRVFDEDREVWHQQSWEEDKHFNAFECYRMLPRHSRSLRDGWRNFSKNQHAACPSGGYKNWYKKNDWKYRVELWDRFEIQNHMSEERRKLDEIRLDGLNVIHNGITRLGKLIYDTKKPIEVSTCVSQVARTLKDIEPKNPLLSGNPEGYDPEPYQDPWGWNAGQKKGEPPDA